MAVQIQLRRDTASNWTSANPTLAVGEFAIETDTDKYKIGDGTTVWASLSYSSLPSNVLPLTGGTMTGTLVLADNLITRPVLKDVGETNVTNTTSGAAATVDLESGNVHNITLTANCTLTFSNPPASGTSGTFALFLNQDAVGSRTVTWPASVKWAGGTAPTLTTTASRTDILVFTTIDAGTIWYGAVSGQDFS
jgi:hypothetical protein